ncbi:DUF924 domain-containing protein [Roseibium sp. CAU 1637]|uniref:DUF924 domain-containing protein n=1 Tax=Roseibium limicola TaxID=2816037 RepID=A0A939ETB6_9HYPH|nr:DUF924 family protein [Roseibium limicola]MBO0346744.1 DUF924 domain-containing protein [Roseibium limicola]
MDKGTAGAIDVIDFWWAAGAPKWFARDDAFDAEIRTRFSEVMKLASEGKLSDWEATPHGTLALIILLDQFPRNVYRGDAKAFASDPDALRLARHACDNRFDIVFPKEVRAFFYLPFEHAEDMAAQDMSVDLCRRLGIQNYYHYALLHMDVIRRFGRFPHRNQVLGRDTTPEEAAYLKDGGFSA